MPNRTYQANLLSELWIFKYLIRYTPTISTTVRTQFFEIGEITPIFNPPPSLPLCTRVWDLLVGLPYQRSNIIVFSIRFGFWFCYCLCLGWAGQEIYLHKLQCLKITHRFACLAWLPTYHLEHEFCSFYTQSESQSEWVVLGANGGGICPMWLMFLLLLLFAFTTLLSSFGNSVSNHTLSIYSMWFNVFPLLSLSFSQRYTWDLFYI